MDAMTDRERDARALVPWTIGQGIDAIIDRVTALIEATRKEEREVCLLSIDELAGRIAEVAIRDPEDMDVHEHTIGVLDDARNAIRARGNR